MRRDPDARRSGPRPRLRMSPDGIRSRGLWRTRFVAWDSLMMVNA
ncbi:PH domain-containing protein [Streptomyces sp. NPDC001351]